MKARLPVWVRPRVLLRFLLAAYVVGMFFISDMWQAEASASSVGEDGNDSINTHKTIAIFPRTIPIYLSPEAERSRDIDVGSIRRALIEHIKTYPILSVPQDTQLKEVFEQSNVEIKDALVQAEIDMAYAEVYVGSLNFGTALQTLDRVLRNYREALAQYFEPQMVSRAHQIYASTMLAQMRESDAPASEYMHQVRRAFIEMIRLTPHIVLLEGRQPKERVQLYNIARELFLNHAVYRQTPVEDARQLSGRLSLDYILFVRIVQRSDGSFFVEVDFYDDENDRMSFESIDIPDNDLTPATDGYSAFVENISSRMDAYYEAIKLPEPESSAFSGQTGRFYLEVGSTYFFFARYMTPTPIHTLGGTVKVSFMFNEHFFVQGGFFLAGAFQDAAHHLYDTFMIARVQGNFGLSADFDWIRPFVVAGFEYAYLSPYAVTSSIICKTFGSEDIECLDGDIRYNNKSSLFGFDVALGINVGKDPFFLVIESFLTLYVAPISGELLRLPIGATLSLQYRF